MCIEAFEGFPVFTVCISSDDLLRVEPRFSCCPACSPVTVFISTHPSLFYDG